MPDAHGIPTIAQATTQQLAAIAAAQQAQQPLANHGTHSESDKTEESTSRSIDTGKEFDTHA